VQIDGCIALIMYVCMDWFDFNLISSRDHECDCFGKCEMGMDGLVWVFGCLVVGKVGGRLCVGGWV